MMELLTSPEAWVAFLTLAAMEIVLGIDNVVFIAIIVGRVGDLEERERLRKLGLGIALAFRIGLLFVLQWIMGLTEPLFTFVGVEYSGRDLILLGGGLFLIAKTVHEMHAKLESGEGAALHDQGKGSTAIILAQIVAIDVVFSLDSVITAVGMASDIPVMIGAMVVAVGVMLAFAQKIGDFVDRHPTIKMLALSFLLLIGVLLVAEGFDQKIPKGYIYFAMAFSLGVELLNMRLRHNRAQPVHLHSATDPPST